MVKKEKDIQYYEAVGRRKRAVARVRLHIINKEKIASVGTLKIKPGEIYINGKHIDKFLTLAYERLFINNPLLLTNNEGRFGVSINVSGGGRNGQLEAMVHGISRALEIVDKTTYRPILKKQGMLKRDPRKKERRKVGTGGKARRVKQSPKR